MSRLFSFFYCGRKKIFLLYFFLFTTLSIFLGLLTFFYNDRLHIFLLFKKKISIAKCSKKKNIFYVLKSLFILGRGWDMAAEILITQSLGFFQAVWFCEIHCQSRLKEICHIRECKDQPFFKTLNIFMSANVNFN